MDLTAQLINLRTQSRDLPVNERAEVACRLAKQFEKAGDYEQAGEALFEFWPDRAKDPRVSELDELSKAEVLLRIGAVASWLGWAEQRVESQESARNVLTRSIEIFDALGFTQRATEARGELGMSYWREGSYDEARINLAHSLSSVDHENCEL